MSIKNESLEAEIKKMVDIQMGLKQKNAEALEKNKLLEKHLNM